MKIIKYKFLSCEINRGTEENPDIEQIFLEKEIYCGTEAVLQANLPVAQREAWEGGYTVEDDGQPEPDATPTLEDRVGTLESDSAETKEALELLLSGVTE